MVLNRFCFFVAVETTEVPRGESEDRITENHMFEGSLWDFDLKVA